MSCHKPLKAYPTGQINLDTGKPIYQFVSSFMDPLWTRKECINIPCQKCLGCRLDYARQWADRCLLEMQYHDSAYFVTLTYNDEHVPKSYYPHPDTGEAMPVLTLSRRDPQLFLKRLRKAKESDTIRYFGCAEYGPDTWRPHYHMILFGLHLDDCVIKRQNVDGTVTAYTSKALSDAWSVRPFGNYSPILDPIGDVECSSVTWAACNYVSRYIVKKQLGPDGRDFYEAFNLLPPYSMMSRMPGIGRAYYDDHKEELYKTDCISLAMPDGGRNIRPPRYYDKIFDIDHPDELAEIKAMRQSVAQAARDFKLKSTSLSVFELEELEERLSGSKIRKEYDI